MDYTINKKRPKLKHSINVLVDGKCEENQGNLVKEHDNNRASNGDERVEWEADDKNVSCNYYRELVSILTSGNRSNNTVTRQLEKGDARYVDNDSRGSISMHKMSNNGDQKDSDQSDDNSRDGDEDIDVDGDDDNKNDNDEDDDDEYLQRKSNDIYYQHFHTDLDESFVSSLNKEKNWSSRNIELPSLGSGSVVNIKDFDVGRTMVGREKLVKSQLKEKLWEKAIDLNRKLHMQSLNNTQYFTGFQHDLMDYIFRYQDVLYPYRSHEIGEEIRMLYCLHLLNHSLKLRSLVRHHNAKITKDGDKEFRDQSLIRPKVLILLPFRSSALKVVNMLLHLLPERQFIVSGKKRFLEEFGLEEEIVRKSHKPADYEHLFAGNTDDCFKLGISFTKKAVRLYSDFYTSDIIIASPLGLRTVIGADGDKDREYDFLNSIEILILDEADVLQMQNWEHMDIIMRHLHLQPRDSHGADFSRCRLWNLNGWGKYYRQTLVFSSILTPEILSLYNRHFTNFAGKLLIQKMVNVGSISNVIVSVPHVFHRIQCDSHKEEAESRCKFFTREILPQYLSNDGGSSKHVLIFIPSYFDYVKIRNHLKRNNVKFSAISETVKSGNVNRARNSFFQGDRSLLLYTERYHFFRRTSFKRVCEVIFYQLPHYAVYYSEICNMLMGGGEAAALGQSVGCTVLYSRYDALALSQCVTTQRAAQMIASDKLTHTFVTELAAAK